MVTAADGEREQRGGTVISNVFDILRCFTTAEPELGVTAIASRVGLHKSSVSRTLAALEAEGVVERDGATLRYRLGLGLMGIAAPLLASLDVRRAALPGLEALRDQVDETVALCVWDGHEAVSVEQVESTRNVKQTSALGSRYGTARSATVQVFCAYEPVARVRRLLSDGRLVGDDLEVAEYLAELERVRGRGIAYNDGATFPDEAAVAAPVLDHRGKCIAAVLIAAPRYRVERGRLEELGAAAAEAATAISRRMGAPAPLEG